MLRFNQAAQTHALQHKWYDVEGDLEIVSIKQRKHTRCNGGKDQALIMLGVACFNQAAQTHALQPPTCLGCGPTTLRFNQAAQTHALQRFPVSRGEGDSFGCFNQAAQTHALQPLVSWHSSSNMMTAVSIKQRKHTRCNCRRKQEALEAYLVSIKQRKHTRCNPSHKR